MDSEHVNEALVYGLDNADPLQELDLGDESNLVSNFRPLDAIMLKDAKIEKDTEKAEIAKLREELSKALELNRTITVSYRDLLQRNIERTPQKSETKRKLCSLLQEELEEKNIYCMNVTSKLNNYKKKYQALKLRFDRLRPRTTEVAGNDSEYLKLQLLEKENEILRRTLEISQAKEVKLTERLKLDESPICGITHSHQLVESSLVVEKLKAKASSFNRDADKIFESISSLKEVIGDLIGTTPSTNWRDDEGLMIEVPEPVPNHEEGHLGKRQSLVSEQTPHNELTQNDATMDQEAVKTDQQVSQETPDELPPHLSSSMSVEEPKDKKQEPKTTFKIDHGSSDDEESSLSSSYQSIQMASIDQKLKQMTQERTLRPEWLRDGEDNRLNSPWKSSEDSDKVVSLQPTVVKTAPKVHAVSSLNSRPTQELKKEPFQTSVSPTICPTQWMCLPMPADKVVMPAFLLSADPKPAIGFKPANTLMASSSPEKRREPPISLSAAQAKLTKPSTKQASNSLQMAWDFLSHFKLSGIRSPDQRKAFFSILKCFRDESKALPVKPKEEKSFRKTLLDQLLQPELRLETYSLKELVKESTYDASLKDSYHCFIFQSIFFVVFISCFEAEVLAPEEIELSEFFLKYRNSSEYLAEKFDKLVEVFKLSKNNPASKRHSTNGKPFCHHFPLLKIVFNNMVFAIERLMVACPTDEEFRSDLLSRKRNVTELKDSCLYSMKNLARGNLQFEFLEGLEDFLGAIRKIFEFSRVLNLNMSKIYFDSLKGFFCHKYRNTSQQIVTFLILNQLNQLDPASSLN